MSSDTQQPTLVVIGNGMVGHRFCEKLVEYDTDKKYRVVTFCEEPRAAYDRVGLTSFFTSRDVQTLMLADLGWYRENRIELHVGDRAAAIDRERQIVTSERGLQIRYDYVVLATGSNPFVPPLPGIDLRGVFLYRTIEHLEQMIDYAKHVKTAAVIGGGLLGLEAAKAMLDLGLQTSVIEFAGRLMPRQVDDAGSRLLVRKIQQLGVKVMLNKATKAIVGHDRVEKMIFTDDEEIDIGMVVVSAGIRPRDELARKADLRVGERGGVIVDDRLRTSDERIFAIGEVASHLNMVYGLVAPGYEMADICAHNFCAGTRFFHGADLSTKLKLMGVDVASFGDYEAPAYRATALVYEDPFGGTYKKLLFNNDGKQLLGGILVGDANDYPQLASLVKSGKEISVPPHELMIGKQAAGGSGIETMDDDCQVCSCNNVTKGQLCEAIRAQDLVTVGAVKTCTKAGTGCGGCLPLVTSLLNAELAAAGKTVNRSLCEHFSVTRQELFEIVKIKQIKTFEELLTQHGQGLGCEVCKPAAASIFASIWNEPILNQATLQDTNDRFLANLQRDGTYSVVPRVPGGEITPDKLIALGVVANRYQLYSKITGGQRVDLFGARVQDLPDIWEQLIDAGFESGHAYGKALRTVKSCVGSTWCRYGVQDSVGFAIRIENRYKGIRAPHKLKGGVSGCIRECAEAQGKDFGLIATEKGYNLYVCGNGGSKPRHAELLAGDLDEETAIRYLDRFLMYYIHTADRLTRTSVWMENLPGGIDYLRDVVIHDRLGLAAELDRQMQHLVDTYQCEWTNVVNDPERRKWFKQFMNSEAAESSIEFVHERGQRRPADWPKDGVALADVTLPNGQKLADVAAAAEPELEKEANRSWVKVGVVGDFPQDGGSAIKYGKSQLAVFNFSSRGQWYATQNRCPHKQAFVLARGIVGDQQGIPKVACPLHKKSYALDSGACLSGEDYSIRTFAVKVEGADVFLELPPESELDAELATELHCIHVCPAPALATNGISHQAELAT
ncbi:MAG TPA: nitrite reductase large subunit NirB [Pirellulales bacterium]|jgi:nitrite reductase (NADH) large subunit|nr:nitrite reductase large subunit NirB [Pirellulales bacterium]